MIAMGSALSWFSRLLQCIWRATWLHIESVWFYIGLETFGSDVVVGFIVPYGSSENLFIR